MLVSFRSKGRIRRMSRMRAPSLVALAAALAHPQSDEAGNHRHQEDLAEQGFEDRQRLRQPDRRRQVAEAERRQRDEAEIEELRRGMRPGLREERGVPELVHGQVDEGKQSPTST